jgi:hypothetical protein
MRRPIKRWAPTPGRTRSSDPPGQRSESTWSARPHPDSALDAVRRTSSAASPMWKCDGLSIAHLLPGDRRRDGRLGPGAQAIGHHRRRHALVAQTIDEDPALALRLWQGRGEILGITTRPPGQAGERNP